MWEILAKEPNGTTTRLERQTIYRTFVKTEPVPRRPIAEFFATLINPRNKIVETKEAAISDMATFTKICLPPLQQKPINILIP